MEYVIVIWTIFNKEANAIMTNADVIPYDDAPKYVNSIHKGDGSNITAVYRLEDGIDWIDRCKYRYMDKHLIVHLRRESGALGTPISGHVEVGAEQSEALNY